MKKTKKFASIILAIIMAFSSVSMIPAFGAPLKNCMLDENGNFLRLSYGEYITYDTNLDNVIKTVKSALEAHESRIEIRFAATQGSEYFFDDDYEPDSTDPQEMKDAYKLQQDEKEKICLGFVRDLFYSAFENEENNPFSGDYLYNSIIMTSLKGHPSFSYSYDTLPNEFDVIDGVKYSNITVTFSDITYYTTLEQEAKIREAISKVNEMYIHPNDTEYKKLKSIYDFIVRHIKYDDLTRDTKGNEIDTPNNATLERYKNSHSAYGALFGTRKIDEINYNELFKTKASPTDESVLESYDEALAVCEGFSKLFYAMCLYNGIECRMIAGDYTEESGHLKEAHEWNLVRLDGEWYTVDTTFASKSSLKAIDFNNYDYFLRSPSNKYWQEDRHQKPYVYTNNFLGDDNTIRHQLEDWYSDEYKVAANDYNYAEPEFESVISHDTPFLIVREYTFNDEERASYLLTSSTEEEKIEINEFGEIVHGHTAGLQYNGIECDFTIGVPYMVNGMIAIDKSISKNWIDAGNYSFTLESHNGTNVDVPFTILPVDMSGEIVDGLPTNRYYNAKESSIDNVAGFTGSTIIPRAKIVNGYGYRLQEGKDYDIKIYSDANRTKETTINNIGTYYIDIAYKGNYVGNFQFIFMVDKVYLNNTNLSAAGEFKYYPEKIRKKIGINSAYLYANYFFSNLRIGVSDANPDGITITGENDYTISATGSLNWDDKGTVTLTGKENSKIVSSDPEKSNTFSYHVTKQYDISSLNGHAAVSTPLAYTGKAVVPSTLDLVENDLTLGVDYRIVPNSYENNVKQSTNEEPAYVTIEGINGCTGKARMYYYIKDLRVPIQNCFVGSPSASISNNKLVTKYTLKYDGKALVKNVDYKETFVIKNGMPSVVITGLGNYKGEQTIVALSGAAVPSSSGNYITLSYASTTYSGSAKVPTVTVYNKSKKKLLSNFYTYTYTNNKAIGTATVTVKFTTGQPAIKKTFIINPKATSISKLTAGKKSIKVTWAKQASCTPGYQIQYSTSKKFTSAKTIKVAKNTTTSYTITKLTKGKTYYVRIRTYKTVGGKTYYSGWSTIKYTKAK